MQNVLLACGLSLLTASVALAQRTVSGTVTDETGERLIGVNVVVGGTTTGTVTDFDGAYTLSLTEDATALAFSYLGYEQQDIEIGRDVWFGTRAIVLPGATIGDGAIAT